MKIFSVFSRNMVLVLAMSASVGTLAGLSVPASAANPTDQECDAYYHSMVDLEWKNFVERVDGECTSDDPDVNSDCVKAQMDRLDAVLGDHEKTRDACQAANRD